MYLESITIKIIDTFNNNRTMIVEQTAVGAPKLVYNGADDKYQPIMTSEFTFNMVVTDKTDGKFFHLYTGNEKRYKVVVEDHLGVMFYEGFLLPDFYEEPYKNGAFFVGLTSTDGVGLLKGRHLPNVYYRQETSVIKLIAECLKLTGLEKEIHFSPAILSAATNYRWDEIAIDGSCYLEGEIKYGVLFIEIMPNRKSAYEILAALLESIGCTLYSQAGIWYIEGINRKHEENQPYQKYTFEGVYVGDFTDTKAVNDVVFFTTPNVSIVSPWKRIDISWSPDENGNLLADDILSPISGNLLDYWKINGAITLDLVSKDREFLTWIGQIQNVYLPVPQPPFHMNVMKQFVSWGPYDIDGETTAGTAVNFVSFKKPYYLKTSDEYINRELKFTMNVQSQGNFPDQIKNGQMEFVYRYDMNSGVTLFKSSRPEVDISLREVFKCDSYQGGINIQDVDPNSIGDNQYLIQYPKNTGIVEFEKQAIPNNGFLQLKLMGPVSPDPENPFFTSYTITDMELEYTAQKIWEDSLTRGIDFTTVKKLDFMHGDSIQDLSIKQFRFRRPIYNQIGAYGPINIISYTQLFPLQPWFYHYFISYADFVAINANPELLYVVFGGQNILLNDLYSAGLAWSTTSTWAGLYYITIDSQLIDHASGIGTNISDFLNMNLGESDIFLSGYVTEDNEWRESWKRYGQTEDIRYGLALGKMYHDVQPEALVKIEGNGLGCFFPREILQFMWRNVTQFIPTRLAIDFTTGRTNVLLLESKHSIVTDYVN